MNEHEYDVLLISRHGDGVDDMSMIVLGIVIGCSKKWVCCPEMMMMMRTI